MTEISQNIVILGATGSVGENAVKVVRNLGDINVVGVAANTSYQRVAELACEFSCQYAAVSSSVDQQKFEEALPDDCIAGYDLAGLLQMATDEQVDTVFCSIAGTVALNVVLAAIRAGKNIALASKEILVMAGDIVMAEAEKYGVNILPVDSEHSAIFQCLEGKSLDSVKKIFLTGTGGPFRTLSADKLSEITVADALAHPRWDMGKKITIDSATLMNKGLELIEAVHLFGISPDSIEFLIHPEAIVHSMVEFTDGSVLAQMNKPDMKYPIQYALTWPERKPSAVESLNFAKAGSLTFEEPDVEKLPAFKLAIEAVSAGGTLPAVLNGANEIAVMEFLNGDIPFCRIWQVVAEVMALHELVSKPELEEIIKADAWARNKTSQIIHSES